ncbi:MAG: hypothetical protein HYS17_03845 [Micavibrio aeruginosavorus]|uniref:Pili assembly chaperone N-terminal domain-containing protein n=1 Tax=Micavibrio aeruginosavorus TaxID=349221 RepID=A0A7T5R3P2_9BACT|nr:MAG: hypothetical protein HYS17_03845 [Micavibrio aeruginosavorus]
MKHLQLKAPARRLVYTGLAALVAGLTALTLWAPDAQALKVTLKRAVFEGPRRTEVLTIINNSAEEQAYRLGWRMMRMTENQSMVAVDDPAQAADLRPVDEMIRYAPRRIVIPPGGTQQVRLLLRKPKDLAEGEYRSHFWIQPEAESVKFEPPSEEMAEAAKTKPVVQIKMLTGITIPVIVRHGKLSVKSTITDARVARDGGGKAMNVGFTLNREGNRSVYGDLKFICNGGTLAKQIKGIAVYTEITKRFMNFSIPYPEGGVSACSSMKIEYIADEDDLDLQGVTLAAAEVAVQ